MSHRAHRRHALTDTEGAASTACPELAKTRDIMGCADLGIGCRLHSFELVQTASCPVEGGGLRVTAFSLRAGPEGRRPLMYDVW